MYSNIPVYAGFHDFKYKIYFIQDMKKYTVNMYQTAASNSARFSSPQ